MSEPDESTTPEIGLTPLGERYATPAPAGTASPWAPPNPRDRDYGLPQQPERRLRPWRRASIAIGILFALVVGGLVVGSLTSKPAYIAKVISVVAQEPNTGTQPDGSQVFDFGYTYALTYSIANHSKDQTVQPTCTQYLVTGSTHFMADMYGTQVSEPIEPGQTVEFTVDISPPSGGGSPVTSAAGAPSYEGGVDCKD
jgi:hypothetical protein